MLGTSLGNYRVVQQLGEGGMGVVYIGRHEALSRQVVVKVLRPEMSRHTDMVQRFFNEAQAATAIHNPGIVQVFDFGTAPDGSAFIVMELLQGETLTARLQQRRLDIVECCRIGRQIANVLQAAHAAGITHRDLKPDNLFLVPDAEVAGGERVKVLDFGIAKLAGELYAAGVQTRADVVMGTPSYMSPEQCRSAVTAGPRSDIYSLGCILFEMVCGQPPFTSGGLGDIIGAHLHTPPPDPRSLAPDVPPALAELIRHLLAKKPDARPETMAVVSQQLDEVLRMLGEPLRRAPTPLPVPDPTLLEPPGRTRRSDPKLPLEQALPLGETLLADDTLPRDQASHSQRATTPVPVTGREPSPAAGQTPLPEPAPTPVSAPSSSAPHERPTAPMPVPPSLPLSAHPQMPFSGPQSASMNGSAKRDALAPRARKRQQPLMLGGLAILGAVGTAIGFAAATDGPARQEQQISSSKDAAPPRHEGEAADAAVVDAVSIANTAVVADAAIAPALAQPTADAAEKATPTATADDLEKECLEFQENRKWSELAQCADKLHPLHPKHAAELKTRAVEEIKGEPRTAAFEVALHNNELKQAKAELDQIWPGSTDYPSIKRKYEHAETQAINDLAAQLARVKSANCAEYNALLAKARTLQPARVTVEASRRIPCSPPLACIGDAYAEKGQEHYAAGRLPAALASYEAAYACRQVPEWAEKAFVISCNLANPAKAKLYWKRLPLTMKARALGICERNGLTVSMLNAP